MIRQRRRPGRPAMRRTVLLTVALGLLARGTQPISAEVAAAAPEDTSQASGAYVQVETWRSNPGEIPPALWREPAGIAVSESGQIVTTDAVLARGELLLADGTPVLSFGTAAPGTLVTPGHVALDASQGTIYAADPGSSRVQVYDASGNHTATWEGFGGIAGIATAADGTVVVGDNGPPQIRILQPDGSPISSFGPGTGLSHITGVHVNAETVFVADDGAEKVFAFDRAGTVQSAWSLNHADLGGARIRDVFADETSIWVATDVGIARMDRARGHVSGLLKGIVATAVDGNPTDGIFAAVTGGDGLPGIYRYLYQQSSGAPQAAWGGAVTVPGLFDGLESLEFGLDGAPYVTDVPPRLQRLGPSGGPDLQIEGQDFVEVTADVAGNIYAATNERVYAFAPDGSSQWEAKIQPSGLGRDEPDVRGIGWDPRTSEVLVLESASGALYSVDASGTTGTRLLTSKRSSDAAWTDVKVSADGSYVALDQGNGQVRGWAADRRPTIEIDLTGQARYSARLDLAPDGSVLTLSPSGWAHRIAPDGTVLAAWDTARLDLGSASRPADIAVDAAGRVYIVDAGADVITVYEWDPAAAPPPPPTVEEGCEVVADKRASPTQIELGESVEINLSVRGVCAAGREAVDYAFILDESISPNAFRGIARAVDDFLQGMEPGIEKAVVQAGGPSRLTGDIQLARRMLRKINAGNAGWDLARTIRETNSELYGPRGRRDARKVVIYMLASEGIPSSLENYWEVYQKRREIQEEGQQLKRRGAEVFGIWFGSAADGTRSIAGVRLDPEQSLRDLVTSRNHYFEGRSELHLRELQEQIRRAVSPVEVFSVLTIADELPANMELVEGSARPPATVQGRVLSWRLTNVPMQGVGISFRVVPQQVGEWPTNVAASGQGETPTGLVLGLTFPVPVVTVGSALPTSTPPPSATPPSPTVTASPTDEATPTTVPSPTPGQSRLYLPIALSERCAPAPIDVSLVIDSSISMSGAKLAGAVSATRVFLDLLDLPIDRASIVAFNSEATLVSALTGDRAQLDAALDRIELGSGTRIDAGLEAGLDSLINATDAKAMILLTDGRQDESPDAPGELAARIVQQGIDLFVIGLGDDVDGEYLTALAGSSRRYYFAPTEAQLEQIYRDLSAEVRCPADQFWGGR